MQTIQRWDQERFSSVINKAKYVNEGYLNDSAHDEHLDWEHCNIAERYKIASIGVQNGRLDIKLVCRSSLCCTVAVKCEQKRLCG